MTREMAELGMIIARDAAAKATNSAAPDSDAPHASDGPRAADPGLTFSRATRAVREAIALENKIVAGNTPSSGTAPGNATSRSTASTRGAYTPRAQSSDPRAAILRRYLRPLADAEPDRITRNELRRAVDERITDELAADPAGAINIGDIFASICDQLGLTFDVTKLPDEILGQLPIDTPDH